MSFFSSLHSPHNAGQVSSSAPAAYATPGEKNSTLSRSRGFSNIDDEGAEVSEIEDLEECVLDSDEGDANLSVSYTVHRDSIASAFDEDEFADCVHENYFGGILEDAEIEGGAREDVNHENDSPENDERETSTHTQIMDAHELHMLMVADSVCRLYDVGANVDMDRILNDCYSADASFTDPLVSTRGLNLGREGVRAQFSILRFMIAESEIVLHGAKYDPSGNVLYLVTHHKYRPRFCYFSLAWHATVTCAMDEEYRIRDHTDQWSATDLISCVPVAGTIHWLYVLWVGFVTSMVTIILSPASWAAFKAHACTLCAQYHAKVEAKGEAFVEGLPPRVRETAMRVGACAAETARLKASSVRAAWKASQILRGGGGERLASVEQ